VLQGGIGGLAVVSGLGGARFGRAQEATPAPDLPRFDGETLRIFTFAGNPFIEGPVKAHAPEFEALTGATVEIVTAPFNDLFTRAQQVAQTGAGDFDVLLLGQHLGRRLRQPRLRRGARRLHRRRRGRSVAGLG
jgi:ABC-type glycerol-3-phosphate transport system substrate-binding protein